MEMKRKVYEKLLEWKRFEGNPKQVIAINDIGYCNNND